MWKVDFIEKLKNISIIGVMGMATYTNDKEKIKAEFDLLVKHLKELKNAELIQGELKPPKIKYCINQNEWRKAKKLFNDFFEVDFNASSCENC